MVAEVENIVRSIEDEKIQKEERDKTRDILARIEGLDRVKQLAAPKPSRVLVEERILTPRESGDPTKPLSPPPTGTTKAVKGKTSFKRLSDVLQGNGGGVGGKKDMWLVVFNDVVLRCQRTGTTSLPLGSAHASRTTSLPEIQGKSKYATTGRRNSSARPRNLYKFIKVYPPFLPKEAPDDVVNRLRIGPSATSFNPAKVSCQWKSKSCRNIVRKRLST